MHAHSVNRFPLHPCWPTLKVETAGNKVTQEAKVTKSLILQVGAEQWCGLMDGRLYYRSCRGLVHQLVVTLHTFLLTGTTESSVRWTDQSSNSMDHLHLHVFLFLNLKLWHTFPPDAFLIRVASRWSNRFEVIFLSVPLMYQPIVFIIQLVCQSPIILVICRHFWCSIQKLSRTGVRSIMQEQYLNLVTSLCFNCHQLVPLTVHVTPCKRVAT